MLSRDSVALEMRPEGWITWKTLQYFLVSFTIPVSKSLKCFECGTPNTVSLGGRIGTNQLIVDFLCIEDIEDNCT